MSLVYVYAFYKLRYFLIKKQFKWICSYWKKPSLCFVPPKENFSLKNEWYIFCYQNCSDLLWEKKSCSDWKKVLRFEAEGREFSNFLRSLEQFIQTRSEQFLITDCFIYQLVPGGFSYLINQNNYNSNWKKWLGFRHMQEKLEKKMLCNFTLMIRFISCYNSLRKCWKPFIQPTDYGHPMKA